MLLESWNFSLLGEPLALNFDASMDDSLTMELKKNEGSKAVKVIHVIQDQSSSLSPP